MSAAHVACQADPGVYAYKATQAAKSREQCCNLLDIARRQNLGKLRQNNLVTSDVIYNSSPGISSSAGTVQQAVLVSTKAQTNELPLPSGKEVQVEGYTLKRVNSKVMS